MKIGYFVQGKADEAFVKGLAERYCPDATLALGKFRGSSGLSLRREIPKALKDLHDYQDCDYLVVLTDSDEAEWREVHKKEWARIPIELQHITVFGVANRNIECWLALDRDALATELDCKPSDIPGPNPSGFVKRQFGIQVRDDAGSERIKRFVSSVVLFNWVNDDSFGDFYDQIRRLSKRENCNIPNERERR